METVVLEGFEHLALIAGETTQGLLELDRDKYFTEDRGSWSAFWNEIKTWPEVWTGEMLLFVLLMLKLLWFAMNDGD